MSIVFAQIYQFSLNLDLIQQKFSLTSNYLGTNSVHVKRVDCSLNYREVDIKIYYPPKTMLISFFFSIKHKFWVEKETPHSDVSFSHQNICYYGQLLNRS